MCRFLPCSASASLRFFKNNDNTRESVMKTVAQLLKLKAQQNQEVHTIAPHQMVLEALMVMAAKNVGALPVLKEGKVVGIISERDYARKLVLKGRSSVGTPVSDIMVAPVITVDTHQTVETCMGIMSEKRLRHLPVVENGELIGLLSIGDLVKEAIAEQAELIRQLEQYIRGE
jgi:CBS domain-containing protein